jgi:integrase
VLGTQRTSVGYRVVERHARTEAGDQRHVLLDSATVEALWSWHAQQASERLAWGEAYQPGGYVFTHEVGRPLHPDLVTKVVKRTMLRYGLPATAKLHDLRHFRASALISSGAEIAQVSKALGHKNISVTADLYGNLFDAAQAKLAEQAAGVVPRQGRRTA